MRFIKWGLGLLALLFVSAGLYLKTPNLRDHDVDAIKQRAATYDVQIIRDGYGVPHIYGKSDADASFGLAYAQAEDEWAVMQQALIETRGEAARYFGKDSAPLDYLNDLFRVYHFVDTKYDSHLNDAVKAVATAYADGVNFYGVNNPDAVVDDLLPITAQDVIAGFTFSTPFFYRMDEDLKALFTAQDRPAISPWGRDAYLGSLTPAVRGSNAFAVAPARSDDGHTQLIINSHQPMTGRYAWYEAHMMSDEGLNIAGANFAGVPYLAQGVTPHHGWGQTVNKPDLIDIYALTTDREKKPRHYKIDGEWKDFERSQSKFRVKLWGPFSWPVTRDVLWSDHGPVLSTETGHYAIRFAGMGEVEQIEQWYAMGKAKSFEAWKAALDQNALLSFNMIYADKNGNIGALYNARMPKRIEGPDWGAILPGDRSELIWTETMPVSALPQTYNPASGWLFSANHDPFFMSEAGSAPKRADYSDTYGIPTRMTNRGLRGLSLLSADPSITRDELLSYRADAVYAENSTLRAMVADLLAEDLDDPYMDEAKTVLSNWDGGTDIANRGAALAVLTGVQALGSQYIETLTPPKAALAASIDLLMSTHGRLDPEWGEVNRIIRGDINIALDGAPDVLRAIYGDPADVADDGMMNALAGDTHIMVADWAPDGTLRLDSVHQYGAATLDEASPHYNDQVGLFARGDYKAMPMTWSAVQDIAKESYRPGKRQ